MNVNAGWHTVSLADVAATPWRNGGGVTRELLAWPSQDDWQWRMSVAEVEASGPFSRFEGVQRWFAVLQGAGVVLDIDGERHTLSADSAPLVFDGAGATNCQLLNGPTQDFNLMVREGGARAAARSASCPPPALRAPPLPTQNALPPSLLSGDRAGETRMLRITKSTNINVDAPKFIAVWSINTRATARFDQEFIEIPPQTLAWCLLPCAAEITLETNGALWMEIPT